MLAMALQQLENCRNHYELLGLAPFEADIRVIQARVRDVMRELRKYQNGPRAAEACQQMDLVAAATACLTDPVRKWAYDETLRKEFGIPPVSVSASYAAGLHPQLKQVSSVSPGQRPHRASLLILAGLVLAAAAWALLWLR